jgi:hypothetical protein
MKLTTIALAFAFALSSTFALAYTTHHKHRTHHGTTYQGTVGMGYGQYGRGGSTVGTPAGGWTAPRSYGSPNNQGGLVGGSSNGTYRY